MKIVLLKKLFEEKIPPKIQHIKTLFIESSTQLTPQSLALHRLAGWLMSRSTICAKLKHEILNCFPLSTR